LIKKKGKVAQPPEEAPPEEEEAGEQQEEEMEEGKDISFHSNKPSPSMNKPTSIRSSLKQKKKRKTIDFVDENFFLSSFQSANSYAEKGYPTTTINYTLNH
jgi:hypothetical protein